MVAHAAPSYVVAETSETWWDSTSYWTGSTRSTGPSGLLPAGGVCCKLQSADAAGSPKATTSVARWSGQKRWSIWENYLLCDRSWRVHSWPQAVARL